jgi:hypothetical protein
MTAGESTDMTAIKKKVANALGVAVEVGNGPSHPDIAAEAGVQGERRRKSEFRRFFMFNFPETECLDTSAINQKNERRERLKSAR